MLGWTQEEIAERLGVDAKTIQRDIGQNFDSELLSSGHTPEEIGERLGVSHDTLLRDMKNSHLGKIHNDLGPDWNEKGIAEWEKRTGTGLTSAWAGALDGDDQTRLSRLGWTQEEIAEECGIPRTTVEEFLTKKEDLPISSKFTFQDDFDPPPGNRGYYAKRKSCQLA